MLEFNIGELATRLRSALGVRGRMPLGLDEHTIATILTADVSGPPWRKNPVFAQGGAIAQFSGLSTGDAVLVRIEYPASADAGANSIFIVTGWAIQPLAFVTASGAALPFNAAYAVFRPGGPTGGDIGGTAVNLLTTERQAPVGTSLVPYRIPVTIKGTRNPNYTAPGSLGQLYYTKAGVVQPPTFYPLQMALRPGQAIEIFQETQLSAATDTVGVAVSVQGLFFGLGG